MPSVARERKLAPLGRQQCQQVAFINSDYVEPEAPRIVPIEAPIFS